jgi:[NiFe] hydrogenase large subunit/hydrogenase large subunit
LNAQLIRNLIEGIQFVQDHVIHFYHLHALDWVDITGALKADPAGTAKLAQSISDWGNSSEAYFKGVQNRLKTFVESGQLGLFANAYWGHPAYKLPSEANLMAVAHYLEALDWQRDVIRVQAILGAKNPHPQTYLVGGMAIPIDPNSQNALNADKIALMKQLLAKARVFVEKVYIPDLLAVAPFYKDWAAVGGGVGNFLSYGEFPQTPNNTERLFLPRGVILNKDLSKVLPMDHQKYPSTLHTRGTITVAAMATHCIPGTAKRIRATPAPNLRTIQWSAIIPSTRGSKHRAMMAMRWKSVPWRECWSRMRRGSSRSWTRSISF